jgi:hypothetical protein
VLLVSTDYLISVEICVCFEFSDRGESSKTEQVRLCTIFIDLCVNYHTDVYIQKYVRVSVYVLIPNNVILPRLPTSVKHVIIHSRFDHRVCDKGVIFNSAHLGRKFFW